MQARADTWKKWDGSAFTEPGLCGKDLQIAATKEVLGSNPSITWNTLLQRWVRLLCRLHAFDQLCC